jgi:hypothetical protein
MLRVGLNKRLDLARKHSNVESMPEYLLTLAHPRIAAVLRQDLDRSHDTSGRHNMG